MEKTAKTDQRTVAVRMKAYLWPLLAGLTRDLVYGIAFAYADGSGFARVGLDKRRNPVANPVRFCDGRLDGGVRRCKAAEKAWALNRRRCRNDPWRLRVGRRVPFGGGNCAGTGVG